MWYTSGKHRALKSLWSPRAAKRNHYWKREERGELNNLTCFLESAIERQIQRFSKKNTFCLNFGFQVAEWKFEQLDTDRDGVLKKKELKVNKRTNNEITMLSIAGISKWHKESLEAEKMWEQLCEVTLSYQMDQQSLKWNPRKYQSVLGRKFTTLKHNIAIAVKMLMNVSNWKNAIFSYFWE